MLKIDGKDYKVNWVANTFKRKAEIINGDNSGRLQGNKDMFLDYVGTFFNFTGSLIRQKDCTDEEWDNIFLVLANPINKHKVVVPFGQKTMETDIYVSSLEQGMVRQGQWDSVISVTFTAMYSQWLAGSRIEGIK